MLNVELQCLQDITNIKRFLQCLFNNESTFHNVEVTFTILHINVLRCWFNIYVLYGNRSLSLSVKILKKNLFKQSYRECLIAWDFSKCAKKFALNHIHQR